MSTFAQLGANLTLLARDVVEQSQTVMRGLVTAVDTAAVTSTPVDTGMARSNWIVSVGNPVRSTINPYSPGRRLGIGETQNATAAIAQATNALRGNVYDVNIYLANNVYYIGQLNSGTSTQMTGRFLERAIESGIASLGRMVVP